MPRGWMAAVALLVLSVALLVACGGTDDPTSQVGGRGGTTTTPTTVAEATATIVSPTPETTDLADTDWALITLNGRTVDPTETAISLIFGHSSFMGESGCFSYYGGAIETMPDGRITYITPDWHPDICASGNPTDDAQAYLETLRTVTNYRLVGDRLEFLNVDGEAVLAYRAGLKDADIADTEWSLVTLDGSPLLAGTEITLTFRDGWVGGSGGCNSYGGRFAVVDLGTISIPESISTAMDCPEPVGVGEQEAAYYKLLDQVTGYRIVESRLELLNADGETTLVYEPSWTHAHLDGTNWSLVTLNGGPVVEGSDITLTFKAGSIDGWSGCNAYGRRDIVIDKGSIAIGEVATDGAGCRDNPPGLSRQQDDYYDALAKVAMYHMTESLLELMDADHNILLAYQRR